ncbi:hypothetical protein Hanom_Chr06g00553471 [Helianthus anomalus]
MATYWRKFFRLLIPEVQNFTFVCVKPVKAGHRFDISQITPPASPPSSTFDLSTPPEVPAEEAKRIPVEVEQVGEGGDDAGGAGGDTGGDRGKGVETEAESS